MIKIYIFEYTTSISDKEKSFFLTELDDSEIKMLPNQGAKNFELSLIGKVLAKKIIYKETPISNKNIIFGKTKLGKPIIKMPRDLNLDISISHSGNYLVIGICDNGKIGVDIELLQDINFQVYRNCLSTCEEMYINSSKKNKQRIENFYEIWTKKEACLKALGTGLQRPLPTTQFYHNHIKPRTEIIYNNQQFNLSTLKEDKFVLSVCTTGSVTSDQSYIKLTLDKLWSFVTNHKMTRLNI